MRKLTKEEFVKKSTIIHKSKYDYSHVNYINNSTKIIIVCRIHGKFLQRPSQHLQQHGCPSCAIELHRKLLSSNTHDFIVKAKKKHNSKYKYTKVKYVTAFQKIEIICPQHGVFFQIPNAHLDGQGCPFCAPIGRKQNTPKDAASFINEAMSVHHNRYDYSETEYKTSKTPIVIICPKHGRFSQTPNAHLSHKQGCPRCQLPKGEIKISHFLTTRRLRFVIHKRFNDCRNPRTKRMLAFDFYIPSENVLVEYDGLLPVFELVNQPSYEKKKSLKKQLYCYRTH